MTIVEASKIWGFQESTLRVYNAITTIIQNKIVDAILKANSLGYNVNIETIRLELK